MVLNLRSVAAFLALGASTANAADISSGDWNWNIDGTDMFYAGTSNNAQNLLAQFCYLTDGNCVYAVSFGLNCDKGEKYPALLNSDSGARSIELICGNKMQGQNVLMFSSFEEIDGIIRSNNRIGFVLPLKGDEFKAIRFSLRGSAKALDAMRTAVQIMTDAARSEDVKPAAETL